MTTTTKTNPTDATHALYVAAARLGFATASGRSDLERLREDARRALDLAGVSAREGREIYSAAYEGGATAAANDGRIR